MALDGLEPSKQVALLAPLQHKASLYYSHQIETLKVWHHHNTWRTTALVIVGLMPI